MVRLDGCASADGPQILPTDQVQDAHAIVGGRVDGIEGMVDAVGGRLVARGKIVLTEQARMSRAAIETVREQRPELILLDVMMPDVDGWQVAASLAQDPTTRDVPIVFLSARAAREDMARAQGLGAVGYVVKPFDPVGLGASVREVLERIRRGERELLNRELYEAE